MQARKFFLLALMGIVLIGRAPRIYAQSTAPVQVRVSELGQDIGKIVTVTGRTGYIVTKYENQGLHVFTLRDDYNNEVMVHTIGDTYPVMGATYRITGSPTRINGILFLDSAPDMISTVYPIAIPVAVPQQPSLKSQYLLWAPTALSSLGILLLLGYACSRLLARTPPEWGVLSVTSGPDRGLTVPLNHRRIAIGRGVNPAHDVRLSSGDQTISNRHLLLEYRKGQLYACDMSSNGTRIGGEKLMTDRRVAVNSGDLIHLGTRGTVIIVQLRSVPAKTGLLGQLREPAPLADKTIMLSESPPAEPAWRNLSPEVSAMEEELPISDTPLLAHEQGTQEQSEQETESDADEEDIPHTLAPLQVFTFAGHAPKPHRLFSSNGSEAPNTEGEASDPPAASSS